MINKVELQSIISKYYLNGLVEAVKWDVKSNKINIKFVKKKIFYYTRLHLAHSLTWFVYFYLEVINKNWTTHIMIDRNWLLFSRPAQFLFRPLSDRHV